MKFTTGAMVGDLSGSIGSTTASHNRFGPYFRNRVIPVNPNSTRQQEVRSLFATMVNLWNNTLTPAQRAAWDNWAANTTIQGKTGDPINITGQNAYVRFNVIRTQIGGTRVDIAPTIFNNGNPVTSFEDDETSTQGILGINMAGTAVESAINLSGAASDDGDVAIYLGAPVNASRNFFKGPYQLADSLPIATTVDFLVWATTFITMEQAIALADGQFRSVRFRVVYDDGRLSEKFEALADVVAASV